MVPAELSLIVQSERVAEPPKPVYKPPPLARAELPLMVQPISVVGPRTPTPPPPAEGEVVELPLTMQFVSVAVP